MVTYRNKLKYYYLRYRSIVGITLAVRLFFFLFSLVLFKRDFAFLEMWNRWDALRFLSISEHGYLFAPLGEIVGRNIVWYPVYPLAIKLVSFIVQSPPVASLVVSFVCCVIASILLYELALLDFSKEQAVRAVWFLQIFPTSYFLQAGYSESLFLVLSLGCVLLYRKYKFIWAGILGLLAALTRVSGVLLAPLLLFEPTKKWNEGFKTIVAICVGPVLYLLINYSLFHSPWYFLKMYTAYQSQHVSFPWVGIQGLLGTLPIATETYVYMEVSALIFLIIATCIIAKYIRLSYGVYMLLSILLMTSTTFILSTPRYALTLFPVYFLLAKIKNTPLFVTVSCLFLVLGLHYAWLFNQHLWGF